jgi:hypothetical protein
LAEIAPRFDRIANRHSNGTAPRAVVAHQLFQTPPDLAARMVGLAGDRASMCVLEPSAGLGRILDALKPRNPAEVVAVEKATPCADELRRRSDIRTLVNRDFLECSPDELGRFDCVLMNPPFTMRSDIKHIQHAAGFLLPGSVLVALCMDTHHRETALRPLCSSWEHIPAGAFRSSGTEVPTVLLTIRR